jgi:O-antigen ligase
LVQAGTADKVARGDAWQRRVLDGGRIAVTDIAGKQPEKSAISPALSAWRDPAVRILTIDLLAVLIAVLLPWSTTGVVIAAILWIVALVPTIEADAFLRSLKRPICALPIAMFALALLGTLWSDAPWGERLHAVGPSVRLLALPLLFYHFERSRRGVWVFIAFLASCLLLMGLSWLVAFYPNLSLKLYFSHGGYLPASGVAVRNYIDQSQEFALCTMALAFPVMASLRAKRVGLALLFAAMAASFLLNMTFVVISRTALVTMPFMLGVFALMHLRGRMAAVSVCVAALLAALAWNMSPHLRETVGKFAADYQQSNVQANASGMGSRLEFWQKSLRFFADAPVIGHGTGSIRGLFEKAAVGQVGLHAEVTANPHNQTLNVAVQWGVIGVALLYAMWLMHLMLFRGDGLAAWVGIMVVVQNVVTSLFNSHLFDFHEGWMYVLGVGVAGGMMLRGTQAHELERDA